MPANTVFLRDQGWIHDANDDIWGEITGASEDMFLPNLDEVYLHIDKNHEVHLGQELAIFRPQHVAAAGEVVQIAGTLRNDRWDKEDRIARAKIVESLDVVERGAKVGPLTRRIGAVAPKRNEVDVTAQVVASVHPNEFWGQNQVIFIDKGRELRSRWATASSSSASETRGVRASSRRARVTACRPTTSNRCRRWRSPLGLRATSPTIRRRSSVSSGWWRSARRRQRAL